MRIKFKSFPRKAKKAIKRNFMKTIDSRWQPKEVKIKELRRTAHKNGWDYKSFVVCNYTLGIKH